VTAADYAWAIKRACSPVVNGNYSSILFDIVACEDWRTVNLNKVSKARLAGLAHIVDESIKALDTRTLQIKLKQAAGYFPYVMTTWVTYPSRPDLVQQGGATWWKDPRYYLGNGPFKLVSWTPHRQWVFVRNDHYFRGQPGIKTLVYKEISNSQTELLAYMQGEFDAINPDPSLLPEIQRNATVQRQFIRTVAANTYWLQFNDATPPFTDVRVRQAIADALDRQQFIKQVENGVGQPAGTLLYPGIRGYQTRVQQTYDPARARKLLAAAGYPNGRGFPTEQLRYASDDPASKQSATFWAQELKQVLNITLQVTPTDAAALAAMVYNRDPSLKIYFDNWFQDYPHPQDWLSLIFANGSALAPLGWNDAHFNTLVNRADQLPISAATPLYQEADAYLAQQAPVAFYRHNEVLMLIKPNLKGYVHYPADPFDMTFQPEKIYKTKS
jgi:oligopeptide transport system substrate-binding protein